MPKGENPNSHKNKPTIRGLKSSEISLFQEQWAFLKKIGRNNKSRGAREIISALQIIANRNWDKAAVILGCGLVPEAIAAKLVDRFPVITGGKKNHTDLIQELALGECSLQCIEGNIIRVVNLALVEVVDSDHRKLIVAEAYQQLTNGEIFIEEKIQFSESPEEGARRGLMEELGIIPATLEFLGESLEKNQRSEYRGIQSFARKHQFRATLHPEDARDAYMAKTGRVWRFLP